LILTGSPGWVRYMMSGSISRPFRPWSSRSDAHHGLSNVQRSATPILVASCKVAAKRYNVPVFYTKLASQGFPLGDQSHECRLQCSDLTIIAGARTVERERSFPSLSKLVPWLLLCRGAYIRGITPANMYFGRGGPWTWLSNCAHGLQGNWSLERRKRSLV
jgi:hypothetical protein